MRGMGWRVAAGVALAATMAAAPQAQEPVPARIVSTSPSITETLFALGLGPEVVGVSQYCRFPPEVLRLPKVGTFLKPDAERIVALRPDLVFVNSVAPALSHQLEAMHVRTVDVDDGAMTSVFEGIRRIAGAAGVAPRGEALAAGIQSRLARLREAHASGPRRSVLFIIGRRPGTLADLVAVGPHSYIDSLIDIAGGRNVLGSDDLPQYPRVSMETVLRLDPDVIVDTVDMGDTAAEREVRRPGNEKLWAAYGQLRAVRTHAVFAATTDALVVPGPRIVDATEWLAGLIALRDRVPRAPAAAWR